MAITIGDEWHPTHVLVAWIGAAHPGGVTSAALTDAIDQFTGVRGYLAAASIGLPPKRAVAAMRADLDAWEAADRDPMGYDPTVDNARAHYARLVGVPASQVAYRDADLDHHVGRRGRRARGRRGRLRRGRLHVASCSRSRSRGLNVRSVPLEALAESLTDETWLVVVLARAVRQRQGRGCRRPSSRRPRRTTCSPSATARRGSACIPFDASRFDVTGCHAYKWLCSPRGVGVHDPQRTRARPAHPDPRRTGTPAATPAGPTSTAPR